MATLPASALCAPASSTDSTAVAGDFWVDLGAGVVVDFLILARGLTAVAEDAVRVEAALGLDGPAWVAFEGAEVDDESCMCKAEANRSARSSSE